MDKDHDRLGVYADLSRLPQIAQTMSRHLKDLPDGSLLFQDRPVVLPLFFAGVAVFFMVRLGRELPALLRGETEALFGLLLIAFLGLCGLLLFRRDRFHFDPASQRLRWRKWSLLRRRRGELAFGQITAVTLESSNLGEGGTSYRVALQTDQGALPLTETYSGDQERWAPTVARLSQFLGLEGASQEADIMGLLSQGRVIDAVRQLREAEGLSLTEAKAAVERLRAGSNGSHSNSVV